MVRNTGILDAEFLTRSKGRIALLFAFDFLASAAITLIDAGR
jgi:hypothetical protein